MKILIKCYGGGLIILDDFSQFLFKDLIVKVFGGFFSGGMVYKSCSLGYLQMEGFQLQDLIFMSMIWQDRIMFWIILYYGSVFDGMEFVFDDEMMQLFGNCKESGDIFELGKKFQSF